MFRLSTPLSEDDPLKLAEATVTVSEQHRHLFAKYIGNTNAELKNNIATSNTLANVVTPDPSVGQVDSRFRGNDSEMRGVIKIGFGFSGHHY